MNKDLDFEGKHKEDLERLHNLRLLDDDFMTKVFEDTKCAEFLLQVILKRNDLKVTKSTSQYGIKNLQGAPSDLIFWQSIKRIMCTTSRSSAVIMVQE